MSSDPIYPCETRRVPWAEVAHLFEEHDTALLDDAPENDDTLDMLDDVTPASIAEKIVAAGKDADYFRRNDREEAA